MCVLSVRVFVCPERQTRTTEAHLQGFMIHRRSALPPSPPPLPLRLDTHTHSPAPPYGFCLPHTDFISLCLFSLFSFILSICAPQCVCTLSPSPSKQSKPTPMDSLQLPLAPGLVTHTVSLHWPLRGDLFIQSPCFHQISDYHYIFIFFQSSRMHLNCLVFGFLERKGQD